jgi:hypothetical protein
MTDTSHRLAGFDASDLKLIYRTLHASLMDNVELMDSDFFTDLQIWLRTLAASEGVDTSNHSLWDAWLGAAAVSCEQRLEGRRKLSLV